MDDVVARQLPGIHPQCSILGFDRPHGHLDDHAVAQGGKFLIDRGSDIRQGRRREFLQHGKYIHARRDTGQGETETLAHGLRRSRVGQGLFDV